MYILQKPISDKHLDAIFFDGTIAIGQDTIGNTFKLITYQSGQIEFDESEYIDVEISILGFKGLINDDSLDDFDVDVLVDKFFIIVSYLDATDYSKEEYPFETIYNDYNEAIEEFEKFLSKPQKAIEPF